MKSLYEQLEKDNREIFLELAQMCYGEAKPHGDTEPDLEWLLALLEEYDPVTLYVYGHEVKRKEARTAEAINASTAKVEQLQRGMGYWSQMTAHYADSVSDNAVLKAFEDAGVKRVRWNTEKDDRVCRVCRQRDGKIYPIGKIPPKPHWGCRCYYEPMEK